jgi:hypothetical protein
MFFVVSILTVIPTAVPPGEDTVTVHFVVLPFSDVLATVTPGVAAVAFYVVVNELPTIV